MTLLSEMFGTFHYSGRNIIYFFSQTECAIGALVELFIYEVSWTSFSALLLFNNALLHPSYMLSDFRRNVLVVCKFLYSSIRIYAGWQVNKNIDHLHQLQHVLQIQKQSSFTQSQNMRCSIFHRYRVCKYSMSFRCGAERDMFLVHYLTLFSILQLHLTVIIQFYGFTALTPFSTGWNSRWRHFNGHCLKLNNIFIKVHSISK